MCWRRTRRARSSASSSSSWSRVVGDVGQRLRRGARDRSALPRCGQSEEQAQGAVLDQGAASWATRGGGRRGRSSGPLAAVEVDRSADGRLARGAGGGGGQRRAVARGSLAGQRPRR